MNSFTIDRHESGQTLAAVLRRRLALSWSRATKLVESRQVKLAGQTCADPARRVKTSERVEIIVAATKKPTAPPPRLGFHRANVEPIPEGIIVVYADDHVIVADKPPGLTTMRHPDEAEEFGPRGKKFLPKTLEDFLPRLLNDRRPIIAVHRLDRDTSGLVAFARTPAAAQHLGRQFRAHSTIRAYLAICRGTPREGKIESCLIRDRGDGRRGSGSTENGQRAVTHVKVIERLGSLSLVECRLETGRTHQVRIHLGELGCPLAGERLYDRPLHGQPLPDPSGATRTALHAARLGFVHPATGQLQSWESRLPDDMQRTIERFR